MEGERSLPFDSSYLMPYEIGMAEAADREWGILKSWYPKELLRIQEAVERNLDELDFEGSWIYDDYPDKARMEREQEKLQRQLEETDGMVLEAESRRRRRPDDLLKALWFHEAFHRRCRRKNCHRRY